MPKERETFQIGDKVRYTFKFLDSIFAYGHANEEFRGTIKEFRAQGRVGNGYDIAMVESHIDGKTYAISTASITKGE